MGSSLRTRETILYLLCVTSDSTGGATECSRAAASGTPGQPAGHPIPKSRHGAAEPADRSCDGQAQEFRHPCRGLGLRLGHRIPELRVRCAPGFIPSCLRHFTPVRAFKFREFLPPQVQSPSSPTTDFLDASYRAGAGIGIAKLSISFRMSETKFAAAAPLTTR
ncbi:hypothetical protein BH20VER2_BH20VER2_14460 [soil metagenome]